MFLKHNKEVSISNFTIIAKVDINITSVNQTKHSSNILKAKYWQTVQDTNVRLFF